MVLASEREERESVCTGAMAGAAYQAAVVGDIDDNEQQRGDEQQQGQRRRLASGWTEREQMDQRATTSTSMGATAARA